MIRQLKDLLPLSEKGFSSLNKGIAAAYLKNICEFLPFVVIYYLIRAIVLPSTKGSLPDVMEITVLAAIGVAVCLIVLIGVWLRDRANNIPTYHEMDRMRRRVIEQLIDLPMSYIGTKDRSSLISNIMADCAVCETAMSSTVPFLIAAVLSEITAVAIMCCINTTLALALFCVIPVALLIQILSLRTQAKLTKIQLGIKKKTNRTILEYIEGQPVIRSYGLSGSKYSQLAENLEALQKASLKLEVTAGVFVSGAEVFLQLGIGIVILTASLLYTRGSIDLAVMFLFFAIVLNIYGPAAEAIGELSNLIYMRESLSNLKELLSAVPCDRPSVSFNDYDISFKDVCFSYDPDAWSPRVLDHMTFNAPEGKLTAIVGRSGEGKSTILRLITGLWDACEGQICIGGKDISDVSVECLNKHIAVVDQDVVLFNDTIINNIRVGDTGASEESVIAAAKAARCDEFVAGLPNGYETVISENGSSLSGGERQRISIARAILKDAPIVLLDEPTAFLDPENEELVQQALTYLLKEGKTVLIVAHRISTIADADQILVVSDGRISESGTHDELITVDGLYSKLYRLQQDSYR
jgi:ATP-binding cassette subfamily B protein